MASSIYQSLVSGGDMPCIKLTTYMDEVTALVERYNVSTAGIDGCYSPRRQTHFETPFLVLNGIP